MNASLAPGRIWLQVAAPILGLVAVCGVCAFFIFWSLSNRQDRAFEEDSALLVGSMLAGQEKAVANSVVDYAFWNDAYRAISLDWDQEWVTTNYLSSAVDAMVVFNTRGEIRHVWRVDEADVDAPALGAHVVQAAGSITDLMQAAASPEESDRVVNRFAVFNGRLLLISIAPVGWEMEEALRHGRRPPTDFVACIDFLDNDELTAAGESLGLEQMRFRPAASPMPGGAMLRMPLDGSDQQPIGDIVWRNERPGSAGFAGQITPILLGLVLMGALALWVARHLASRQLAAVARENAAIEASRLKSEFIAAMSHELRTPLNAIIGYSELIYEELEAANFDVQRVRGDAVRITTSGRHLLKLVNDILQHSKIDANAQTVALSEVDVRVALSETVDIIAPLAKANGVALTSAVDADVQSVGADPTLLAQCLINLAGNAVKFSKNGAVHLRARRAAGGKIAIDVIDNGIGIAKEALSHLFAPFQQADPSISKEFGGAGLGLSITRKLARAMRGDVTVVSEPGRGSTFTIVLPEAASPRLRLVA